MKIKSIGRFIIGIFFSCSCIFCKRNVAALSTDSIFDSIPLAHLLTPTIKEVSGIADSQVNPGLIWAEEDSGNPSQIYLVKHDGIVLKRIFLQGVTNRDWEDMTLVQNNIYLAETGDNAQVYGNYAFYKFPEPVSSMDTVKNIETIHFNYADGSHDAEAFLVDSVNNDIYIITKRDNPSKVYRLKALVGTTNVATLVENLPYSGVVSAAMSADGKEILVKTYTTLYEYSRRLGQDIVEALKQPLKKISILMEPQGEAVGFGRDGAGFYTLSEQAWAPSVNLNYYKRHR